jgi:hypothetical protein
MLDAASGSVLGIIFGNGFTLWVQSDGLGGSGWQPLGADLGSFSLVVISVCRSGPIWSGFWTLTHCNRNHNRLGLQHFFWATGPNRIQPVDIGSFPLQQPVATGFLYNQFKPVAIGPTSHFNWFFSSNLKHTKHIIIMKHIADNSSYERYCYSLSPPHEQLLVAVIVGTR